MPIRWGIFHPENSNFVLLATEIGAWQTSTFHNALPDWIPSDNGLGNVRIDMLSVRSDNMVLAASHGRGLFYGIFDTIEFLTGDINLDVIINVLDVVLLVNLVLGSSEYNELGDMNNDMVLDLSLIHI